MQTKNKEYLIDKILNDKDILNKRTKEEQMKLIEVLKNCEYNEYVYKIIVNPEVLEKRTAEEQLILIEELKNNDYNELIYVIAVKSEILENRTIEEQIILMKKLKNCNYNELSYKIAITSSCNKKSIEHQVKSMKLVSEKMNENSDNNKKIVMINNELKN